MKVGQTFLSAVLVIRLPEGSRLVIEPIPAPRPEAFVKVGQTFGRARYRISRRGRGEPEERKACAASIANTRGPAAAWPRVQLRKHL